MELPVPAASTKPALLESDGSEERAPWQGLVGELMEVEAFHPAALGWEAWKRNRGFWLRRAGGLSLVSLWPALVLLLLGRAGMVVAALPLVALFPLWVFSGLGATRDQLVRPGGLEARLQLARWQDRLEETLVSFLVLLVETVSVLTIQGTFVPREWLPFWLVLVPLVSTWVWSCFLGEFLLGGASLPRALPRALRQALRPGALLPAYLALVLVPGIPALVALGLASALIGGALPGGLAGLVAGAGVILAATSLAFLTGLAFDLVLPLWSYRYMALLSQQEALPGGPHQELPGPIPAAEIGQGSRKPLRGPQGDG